MDQIETVALVGRVHVVPVKVLAFHSNGMATVFYTETGCYGLRDLNDLGEANSIQARRLHEAADMNAENISRPYGAAFEAVSR